MLKIQKSKYNVNRRTSYVNNSSHYHAYNKIMYFILEKKSVFLFESKLNTTCMIITIQARSKGANT